MSKPLVYIFSFLFFLLSSASPVLAQDLDMSIKASVYIESSSQETLNDIQLRILESSFQKRPLDKLNLGFKKKAIWLHVTAKNHGNSDSKKFLRFSFSNLKKITAFQKHHDGQFRTLPTQSKDKELSAKTLFPVNIPAQSQVDLLFRIDSNSVKILNFDLLTWQSVLKLEQKITVLNGLFYGIILILFLYSSTVFIIEKKQTYLYYGLFLASYLIASFILQGFHYSLFNLKNPELFDRLETILFMVTFASFNRFSQLFLKSKYKLGILHKALHVTNFILLFFAIQALFFPLGSVMKSFLLFAIFNSLLLTLIAIRKSSLYIDYRAYPIAWLVSNIFGISAILIRFQILPYNFYSQFLAHLAIISTALIFAFALRQRVRHYEQQELEQKRFAKQQAEDARDIILLQKIELEDKVRQRTQDLKIAKDSAEKANKSKSHFLANMSHEIRTPMNAILGFTHLLEGEIKDEEQRSYLKTIDQSGQNLLKIINDILDISKIEAHKVVLDARPSSLESIIRENQQLLFHSAQEKGLGFEVLLDEKINKYILIDEMRLKQILTNLIANAIKFTEEGQILIRTEFIEDSKETLSCKIFVEDTGPGIPEDKFEQIFNAYEQARKHNVEVESTGLGLSISKKLSQLMGLDLSVESTVGEGTTFTLTLNDIPYAQ